MVGGKLRKKKKKEKKDVKNNTTRFGYDLGLQKAYKICDNGEKIMCDTVEALAGSQWMTAKWEDILGSQQVMAMFCL